MAEKFTDVLTYVLSVALAAGVITFAAYKVIQLNGMENPPANMGLNFPPLKRRVIIEEPPDADPITTQSLGDGVSARVRPAPAGGGGAIPSYQLLTVVDGVAFLEVGMMSGKVLLPVTVGATLPGGYRVDSIEKHNGHWLLVAGSLSIGEQAVGGQ